ncbi:hypothetical protein BuS5_00393 [Desulfosarcina sp. BuS5]|uniref:transposase n=1 Tax=Desulfosarcina sp. BuS5 TaxID=933262 RepID=UPI0004812C5B|nr:transposase [Desulfosarcina sp. BuS5]WDN87425.1 hypothetical protein BuS5_00393 [Desulfosarcina sp. BuS5]
MIKDRKFKKKRKSNQPEYAYFTSLPWKNALSLYEAYSRRWTIENNAIKELYQYWIFEDFHCAKFNAIRAHIIFSVVMFNLHILFKFKYGRRFSEKSIAAKRAPGFEPARVIVYCDDYFAIGHCLPIVVAGSSAATVRNVLESSRWQGAGNWFRKGAGAVIRTLGLYFIMNPFFVS